MAIVATYRMLSAVHRGTLRHPPSIEIQRIRLTAFCLLLSLVGFCAASFFLSLAYRFYLPALAGLTIALARAVRQRADPGAATPIPTPSLDIVYALGQ
jgi:hypothetical protein